MESPVIDHRSLIANLRVEQRGELLGKSNVAGLRRLGGHGGATVATTVLVLSSGAWSPLFMVSQGVLIVFLFTALHETVHRTPFRTRALNDLVGRLCGFAIFVAPVWFRYFHLEHHRYTNQPGRDPELVASPPASRLQYFVYLTGVPETVERFRTLARNAVRVNADDFVPESGKTTVQREARIQLALYVVLVAGSVAVGSAVLVTVWLLPFVLGAPFMRAYLLAEHTGCPDDPSMFKNTRTVLTNPLVRAVAWNMPYHAEHHAYPAVPFHKLGAFHEHTQHQLAVTSAGYVQFNRDYFNTVVD